MSVTLTTYRQNAARLIGPFETGTATSGSTTSLLECTAWPFKSTIAQDDLYQDQWLFTPASVLTTDRVRVVKTYSPSVGTFTVDLPYTTAPNALAFELHGMLEPYTQMTQLVNDTLKRCMQTVEFTVTPVQNATRHSLASQSWLLDESWVFQVGWLTGSESRAQNDPFQRVIRGEAKNDGGTIYIEHPGNTFNTSDVIYVKALKPAFYHCAAAAGTLGTQSGLSLESDICSIPADWVAAGVRVLMWDRFSTQFAPGDKARVDAEQAKAARLWTQLKRAYQPLPERTFRPLHACGPRPAVSSQW